MLVNSGKQAKEMEKLSNSKKKKENYVCFFIIIVIIIITVVVVLCFFSLNFVHFFSVPWQNEGKNSHAQKTAQKITARVSGIGVTLN